MTKLHQRTAKKYIGAMASNYETKRKKQLRWHQENSIVADMLGGTIRRTPILDAPVGTGRFIPLYHKLKLKGWGIDSSEEMLAQARKKPGAKNLKLSVGNILEDQLPRVQTIVSVRFLDLIDEPAMLTAMEQFMQAAERNIILTIRFGDAYILKSNTATHDRRKFLQWVRKHGWRMTEEIPIFKQGWYVLRLEKD
jgi:SAM-dependent methyltransferase